MEFSSVDTTSAVDDHGRFSERETSYVDPHTEFDGTMTTSHNLRIEGKASGVINCDGVLTIEDGAHVDAEITAESIVVSGEMSGKVRCRGRLEIRATGIVRGDVKTGALVIVEGARYEGQIAMEGNEASPESTPSAEHSETEPHETSADDYSFLRRFAPHDPDEDGEDENEAPLV